MKIDDTRAGYAPLIFAGLGFIVGAIDGGGTGFIFGAASGWALGLAIGYGASLRRLQARLQVLEGGQPVTRPAAVVATPAPDPVWIAERQPVWAAKPEPEWAAEPAPDTSRPAPASQAPELQETAPENEAWPQPPPRRAAPSAPSAIPPAPPNAFDRAMAEGWDWLRGGNPIAKAGVVILFFGAVFLVKYAAEHSLFPIELRFAALAAGAIALLVIGWRLRERKPGYAQILQGGGVAGLYLVSFAASRLFHLLPMPLALAVMVSVAVLAALLAVAQNSLAMAVIGTGGGFLAPLLVSTGSGSHIALFTYYAILNLGVFTVAWFRAWRVLNLLGLVFTFGIVGVFRGTAYEAGKLISTDAFLLLFFLMYVAVSVLFSLRQKPDLKAPISASLVFGLPVAAFGIHASLWRGTEYALAYSALGFGAFYLGLATVLWNRHKANLRLLCEAFAALGVIFTSLAVPLAFDEQATAAMWAVEGAGLMWLGVRQDRKLPRAFSVLLQVGGTLAFLAHGLVAADALPFANGEFIGFLVLGVAALLSGYWLRREGQTIPSWEKGWSVAAVVIGTLWVSAAGLSEITRVLGSVQVGGSLVWLSAMALLWQAASRRQAWPLLDHLALLLMAVAALLAFEWALARDAQPVFDALAEGSHPAALAGWLGWPVWFAAQYRQLWRREPAAPLLFAQHVATGLLLLVLLVWQSTWLVEFWLPRGFWHWLPSAALLIGALLLLTPATLKPAWPVARHALAYRLGIGWPVAAASALWLLIANASSAGSAAPLPTWPLLNPLDLASVGLLLALARYGLQPASRQHFQLQPHELLGALAALVFLWMNAALVRGLHYGIGTPLIGQGALESVVLQAALSIFWSLIGFAVMLFASRRALRAVWLVGAGLMGVVVVKLFLIDTAGSGTLARIVAFLSVGGVLLVTGYFSPLPPASAKAESA